MSSKKETHRSSDPNDTPTVPGPSAPSKHLTLDHHQQASSTGIATPSARSQPTQLPIRSATAEMSSPTETETQNQATAVPLQPSTSSRPRHRPRPYPDPNPAAPPDIESDSDSDPDSSEEEWNGFDDELEFDAEATAADDASAAHAHAHAHADNDNHVTQNDTSDDSDATMTAESPNPTNPPTDPPTDPSPSPSTTASPSLQPLNALRDELLHLRIRAAATKRREALDALRALTVVNANLSEELQRLLGLEELRGMDPEERRAALTEASAVRILAPEEWHMLVVDTTGFCPGCLWCNGCFGPLFPGWPGY